MPILGSVSRESWATVAFLAAMGCWTADLLPGAITVRDIFDGDPFTGHGFWCLIWGMSTPAWYLWASQFVILIFVLALEWISATKSVRAMPVALAVLTTIVAFVVLPGMRVDVDGAGPGLAEVHSFGPGFYLWIASLLLVGAVPAIRGPRQRRPPGGSETMNP